MEKMTKKFPIKVKLNRFTESFLQKARHIAEWGVWTLHLWKTLFGKFVFCLNVLPSFRNISFEKCKIFEYVISIRRDDR